MRGIDDIRDTRPWFWILFAIVFAVAAVGLVIAISANNSSVNEKKLVNDATAQIRGELNGLNGALKAADEFQEESDKLAQRDRARIKRQVNAAVAGGTKKLRKLESRVGGLEAQMAEVQSLDGKLKKSVSNVNVGQEDVEAELAELAERVSKLERKSGG